MLWSLSVNIHPWERVVSQEFLWGLLMRFYFVSWTIFQRRRGKKERERERLLRILNLGYQTNWAPRRKKGPFLALNCACQEQSSPAVCCSWSSVVLWYYTERTPHLFKNYKLLPFVYWQYLSVHIYSSTYVFKCIFKPVLSLLCPQHELACWVRSCMHV